MPRPLIAWVAGAAALGAAVPLALLVLAHVLVSGAPNAPSEAWSLDDYIAFMLFPIPLMLAEGRSSLPVLSSWGPFLAATLANVGLYGILGALIGLGVVRSKLLLLAPALLIAVIWYTVWTY